MGLSSCQERARGVLSEWALGYWLQPSTARSQHGYALWPWLRGWSVPRAAPCPGPHHRTPHHWGKRPCLPPADAAALSLCASALTLCSGNVLVGTTWGRLKKWAGSQRALVLLPKKEEEGKACCWLPAHPLGHWLWGRVKSAPNGAGARRGCRTLLALVCCRPGKGTYCYRSSWIFCLWEGWRHPSLRNNALYSSTEGKEKIQCREVLCEWEGSRSAWTLRHGGDMLQRGRVLPRPFLWLYPVLSQLISQEPNPGVQYEYYLPVQGQAPGYSWSYGSWSECSSECGGGKGTGAGLWASVGLMSTPWRQSDCVLPSAAASQQSSAGRWHRTAGQLKFCQRRVTQGSHNRTASHALSCLIFHVLVLRLVNGICWGSS